MSRKLIRPTDEEDAAITAAALRDPDALPLSTGQLEKLQPARSRGRPSGSGSKIQVTMRFDKDVVDAFKRGGEGWQTRMNSILRDWLAMHRH